MAAAAAEAVINASWSALGKLRTGESAGSDTALHVGDDMTAGIGESTGIGAGSAAMAKIELGSETRGIVSDVVGAFENSALLICIG